MQQLRLGVHLGRPDARIAAGPADVRVLPDLVEVGEAGCPDHLAVVRPAVTIRT